MGMHYFQDPSASTLVLRTPTSQCPPEAGSCYRQADTLRVTGVWGKKPFRIGASAFLAAGKYLTRNNGTEEGFILAYSLRGFLHQSIRTRRLEVTWQ